MLTKDIFQNDPLTTSLANNGVAKVEDDQSSQALDTLAFELKTFVCDGKYKEGLEHILSTYITQLKNKGEQKGIWISGFFGSGKSHLAKMLRTLWINQSFPNGVQSRSLTDLPASTNALFDELESLGIFYSGLHAASGTLGAGSREKVRLSLLRIIFKSAGLPEQYHLAKFVLWLKDQDKLETVKAEVGADNWQKELRNIHVSPILHKALVKHLPDVASDAKEMRETLRVQFQEVKDVSNDEMIDAILEALDVNGEIPLTLIVLDELQQFVGLDDDRTNDVQEMIEACCGAGRLKSKLLFVATGQSALSGTTSLMRLLGRFQIPVQLEDTDVDSVIRKVILQKKETARSQIEKLIQGNLGEISRHLHGSTIEHNKDDEANIVADYPLLPVRRRFWEKVLHSLDKTGTGSQLRNQLKIVHEACRDVADKELGYIVPADFIYDQIKINAQQNGMISKDIYETIGGLEKAGQQGDKNKEIQARILAIILLIGKIPIETNHGIVSTAENIASLMVSDLNGDISAFRKSIPDHLAQLEKDGLLMSLETGSGTEYRLQTTESALWYDKYNEFKNDLKGNPQRVESFRQQLIHLHVRQQISQVRVTQGESMVPRTVYSCFENELPRDAKEKIYAWVLNGSEKAYLDEARGAKPDEPTIFIYVPNIDRSALQQNIIEKKASEDTIDNRSTVSTEAEAVRDARSAMQYRLKVANDQIEIILDQIFSNIQVKQAGGADVEGDTLTERVTKAAETSMVLLYPDFHIADQKDWAKVYDKARKEGGENALEALGFKDEVSKHPVCDVIKRYIGVSKTGTEIKEYFHAGPRYGWSQDAVDGALYAMLAAGVLTATDSKGAAVDAKTLDRKQLNGSTFRPETVTITKVQLIKVRGLINALGVSCNAGEEHTKLVLAIQSAKNVAYEAGGDAPLPASPDTPLLDSLAEYSGNAQLQQAYENREQLIADYEAWQLKKAMVSTRQQQWRELQDSLIHCRGLKVEPEIKEQMEALVSNRSLLAEPSPVEPLIRLAIDTIRDSIVFRQGEFEKEFHLCMNELAEDKQWQQLDSTKQEEILKKHDVAKLPELKLGGNDAVIESLEECSLSQWNDRRAALASRFEAARFSATEAMKPKVQRVRIAKPMIETEQELDEWLAKTKEEILAKLADGPVSLN